MTETFEHKGKWKLVESDTWFDGTLSFDPDEGASLEIFGSFNSFLDRTSKSIIIGKTIAGDITLVDVWYRTSKSSSNGVVVEIYEPGWIIEGHHFTNENDISFRYVVTRVFNLFQWFDQSGFGDNFDYYSGTYDISYKKLTPIKFNLHERCEGNVLFDSPVSFNKFYNERNLKEQAYFTLDYKEKTNYKKILHDLWCLTGFITLFTYEQSYPISITFKDDDYFKEINSNRKLKFIKCIYQNNAYSSKYKLRRPHEHLVKYKDIKDSFPNLIKNWYDMYFQQESAFTLMLYSFRAKNHFSVDKFMDTVRAIETLHRNTRNNERIPQKDYDKLVEEILGSVNLNNENTEWLTNKLRGNEPSLNKRLKDLIRENQNKFIVENIPDIKRFSLNVTNTRNYHTHYDKSLEEKALKDKDLFHGTLNLLGLLHSVILKELGLNNSDFEEGLKYHLYK
jgi:hypothetical protein